MKKLNNIAFFSALSLFLILLLFTAYGVDRVESKYFTPYSFELFFGVVIGMFLMLPVFMKFVPDQWRLKHFLFLGIGVRLLLFFTEPNLSDDYFRFIWDGTLTQNGLNPFLYLPKEVIAFENASELGFSQELYNGFNSQSFYSVYPPVNQFVFYTAALVSNGSIFGAALVMRFWILLAEIGSIYFLIRLLDQYGIKRSVSLLYILNPLILLELSVNLHFEAFLICFMLGAVYMLEQKKMVLAGLFWGLAICTKLLPLFFLALIIFKYKFSDVLKVGVAALGLSVVLFLPFYTPEVFPNMQDSLDRYFGYFFFNAGIPYAVREYYLMYDDHSILKEAMPVFRQIFFIFLFLFSGWTYFLRKRSSVAVFIFWTYFAYFLLAGILHPWYITILIPFGILSKKLSGFIWSLLIFLSYSAYRNAKYSEDYRLIAIEFSVLLLAVVVELIFARKLAKLLSA